MTSPHPALGIDYGEARIGIAATDPVGIMAHPVETIHRHQTDGISRIVQLVQERGIRTLVLGLPVRMDGTEGTSPPSLPRKNCTPPAKRQKTSAPSSTR